MDYILTLRTLDLYFDDLELDEAYYILSSEVTKEGLKLKGMKGIL